MDLNFLCERMLIAPMPTATADQGRAAALVLLLFPLFLILWYWWIRQRTWQRLVKGGFPTVFWRPKFVHYQLPTTTATSSSPQNDRKMPSSTVTNILPRMQALQGPYRMYGTVYGCSTAVVHVAHPTPALAVLRSHAHQPASCKGNSNNNNNSKSLLHTKPGATKMPAYNHFFNFCGQGVFTADGSDWKDKRSAVLHALMRRQGWEDTLMQLANHRARDLVQTMERATHQESIDTINVVPLLQRATVGLIYQYITDSKLEAPENVCNRRSLHSSQKRQSTKSECRDGNTQKPPLPEVQSLLSSYLQSIIEIRMIILAQARSVWFLLPRWVYRTFSPMFRQEERTMGPIRQFARLACQNARPGSPLARLQENDIYGNGRVGAGVKQISDNLLYETITLLFAGQDTSAATLSWTLHLLTLYPDVQTKLADELRAVLSESAATNKPAGGVVLSRGVFSKLRYLDAVIKESMRLYPVAPFIVRKVTQPLELSPEDKMDLDDSSSSEDTTSTAPAIIPEGALACIWIYGLHRNPEFWSRPDDFVPERWLTNSTTKDPVDKGVTVAGAYMPFAYGPRNCLGQPLAHIILRCLLAHLIHTFEFQDPNPVRKDMQVGFTVLPKGGVSLALQKRYTPNKNE